MNRRNFFRLLAGAGATAAIPPSMVWPFRKIFLPPTLTPFEYGIFPWVDDGLNEFFGLTRMPYPGPLDPFEAAVQRIELNEYTMQIRKMFEDQDNFYKRLKAGGLCSLGSNQNIQNPLSGNWQKFDKSKMRVLLK